MSKMLSTRSDEQFDEKQFSEENFFNLSSDFDPNLF